MSSAKWVRDINQQGVSVLLVEQNAEVALRVSDYSYMCWNRGRSSARPRRGVPNDPDIKKAYLGL